MFNFYFKSWRKIVESKVFFLFLLKKLLIWKFLLSILKQKFNEVFVFLKVQLLFWEYKNFPFLCFWAACKRFC